MDCFCNVTTEVWQRGLTPGQAEVISSSWEPGPTRGTESLPVIVRSTQSFCNFINNDSIQWTNLIEQSQQTRDYPHSQPARLWVPGFQLPATQLLSVKGSSSGGALFWKDSWHNVHWGERPGSDTHVMANLSLANVTVTLYSNVS